jgi:CRP-like cAMP-binding protein
MTHNTRFKPVINHLKKDSYIFVEGKQNADKFYIIVHGDVRVHREAITDDLGSVLGPGDIFGLVSAMAGHGYIESAVAMNNVSLAVIERKHYGDLIRQFNSIAVNNITYFSQRLRELDVSLSHRVLKSAASSEPSHLPQIAEYYRSAGKNEQALYAFRQYLAHCPDAFDAEEVKKKIAELENIVDADRLEYAPNTMIQNYPKGFLLFAEGETGHTMYIVQEGSVKITKIVDNKEVILAVLNKGDIFGEMAILENKPRAATAEICEDCTLLAVNRSNFSKLISEQPDMVVRMATLMSERIWLLYRQLDNTFIEEPLGRIYDALLIQLEKNRVDLNSKEPYQCSFGLSELFGMAGINEGGDKFLPRKIAGDGIIKVINDKVLVNNVLDAAKEASFYRKKQKIEENKNIRG